MKIKLETDEFEVVDTSNGDTLSVEEIEIAKGGILQAVANSVFSALKNGSGFSIRVDNIEVKFATKKVKVTENSETYIGT